jgi:PKD repeat protein
MSNSHESRITFIKPMLKTLGKSLAVLMLTLAVGVTASYASGKMQVKIGERVDLFAETQNPSATLKWIVKKGTEILSTQSTRNFTFLFPTQGEFEVNLTATAGKSVENTTVKVLAGDLYATFPQGGDVPMGNAIPLRITLETLPSKTLEKTVHLLGDVGKVGFNLEKSTGEVLEYRIDRNIFLDSDGNGVGNDDIDNANHNSYLNGQSWQTEYKAGESPRVVAEVTLVDKSGRKAKEQVQIAFDPLDAVGDPIAVLDLSPASDGQDNKVRLFNDPHLVTFYARKSKGKILEYRIDKDILTDSDGNGNMSDDIDNLNDPSFKTGDVWETEYPKTDKQIIAQLTVVGEGGKGSRVQRELAFGDKPIPADASLAVQGGVRLTADKDFVLKGDPITFMVQGLALSPGQYTFGWDLDGDGKTDQETEGVNTLQTLFDVAGLYRVKVKIQDRQGNMADKDLEIVVKDTLVTKADFSFEIDGNKVSFRDLSTVLLALSDKKPEGYESQRDQIGVSNPTYTYAKAGTYIATLTVTDADRVTDSKSAEIEILQDGSAPTESTPAVETPAQPVATEGVSGGSFFLKILKVILYLILIVVALLILSVGSLLAVLKAKHPSLTFEELVDELKGKILSMIGAHDPEGLSPEALPRMPHSFPHSQSTDSPSSEAPEASAPQADEPAWAKKKDIIEGEVETDRKDDDDKTPPSPVNEQGPVPDWLKNVK